MCKAPTLRDISVIIITKAAGASAYINYMNMNMMASAMTSSMVYYNNRSNDVSTYIDIQALFRNCKPEMMPVVLNRFKLCW